MQAEQATRTTRLAAAAGLAAAVLLLFVLRLSGPSNLMLHDQERPASYVLDAVQNGHWVIQKDWTGDIMSKPPLYTWLGALAGLMAGVGRFAISFPAGLAVLGLVLLLFEWGRRIFAPRAAFCAALVFLLCMATAKQVILVRTDGLFAFTVLLTAWSAFAAWRLRASWVWFWLAAAAATLTKGPLGILLGGLGLLACLLPPRVPPGSWRGFGAGLALFIAIVAGWFALACLEFGRPVADKLIFKELLAHAVSVDGKRGLPLSGFYKPWVYFLSRFAPWSALAFIGVWRAWRRPAADALERAFERFLACWLVGGLVVFSFASHQRGDLIYPLLAPGAWLAGREVARLLHRVSARGLAVVSVLGMAVFLAVIAGNDRQSVRRSVDAERSAAIERIAGEIRRDWGGTTRLLHVDTPFALQFHLGTMQTPVPLERAAALLRDPAADRVAVVDLQALRRAAEKRVALRVEREWPLPGGGALHLVTGTAP